MTNKNNPFLPENYFRKDVQGLRALAVIAVIINHVNPQILPGGYLGVDIFFVISGYIITRIIFKEIHEDGFSFLRFYERRVRRIIPPLFFCLIFTALFSFILLLPSDFTKFAISMLGVTTFVGNIVFWRQLDTGYFAAMDEALNPIVHLWSLSVEEQFYIFFPLLLYLSVRRGVSFTARLLILAAALSFVSLLIFAEQKPVATFFLLPFRGWELLAGALVYFARRMSLVPGYSFSLIGMGLVISTLLFLDASYFHGVLPQLLVVIGTAAIIYPASQPKVLSLALESKIVVYLGRISYSMYLYHWPFIVFLGWIGFRESVGTYVYLVLIIILTIFFAALSEKYCERPFRAKSHFSRGTVYAASVITATTLILFSLVSIKFDGFVTRFAPEILALDQARKPSTDPKYLGCASRSISFSPCIIGSTLAPPMAHIWSDSHGYNLASTLDKLYFDFRQSAYFAPLPACPPLILTPEEMDILKLPERCLRRSDTMKELALKHNYKNSEVVLIANWLGYYNPNLLPTNHQSDISAELNERGRILNYALNRTVEYYREVGANVNIIGPLPIYSVSIPLAYLRSRLFNVDHALIDRSKSFYRAEAPLFFEAIEVSTKEHAIRYLDLLDLLCPSGNCITLNSLGVLYFDSNHLTSAGEDFLYPTLRKFITGSAN